MKAGDTILPRRLLVFLALALAASLVLVLFGFPKVVPQGADARPENFSAARALEHSQAVSKEPHPLGTPAHAAVKRYIFDELVRLGLKPEIQRRFVVARVKGRHFAAATVENVFARLPGTMGSIMLMAHYDGVRHSPAACDDGFGVGVLLETARALRASSEPLPRSVKFLFTDGEELGLLGARVFARTPTRRVGVDALLNFDARGCSGPVALFQAGRESARLLSEYAELRGALADSAVDAARVWTEHDTDFTAYLEEDETPPAGLNLALAGDTLSYHTPLDTAERLTASSVQDAGDKAVHLVRALARHSGSLAERPGQELFFTLMPGVLVRMSYLKAALFSLFVGLGAVALGRRRIIGSKAGLKRKLTAGVAFLGALFLLPGAQLVGMWLFQDWSLDAPLATAGVGDWTLALAAATLGFAALYPWLRERWSPDERQAGLFLLLGPAAILIGVAAPSAAHVLALPLALYVWLAVGLERLNRLRGLGLALVTLCLPIVLLALLMTRLAVVIGLLVPSTPAPALLALGLGAGLLAPVWERLLNGARVRVFAPALGVAATALLAGILLLHGTGTRPRFTDLAYCLDLDSGRAFWHASPDSPDAIRSKFFEGAGADTRLLSECSATKKHKRLVAEAPVPEAGFGVSKAQVERVGEDWVMDLGPGRSGRSLSVWLEGDAKVERAWLGEEELPGVSHTKRGSPAFQLVLYGAREFRGTLRLRLSPGAARAGAKLRIMETASDFAGVERWAPVHWPPGVLPYRGAGTVSVSQSLELR